MANHSATHPKHVHHHFVNSNQQFESAKLGMWVFLVNEILFFGGLFCAYIVFRAWYPELFTQAALELNTFWGAVNTVVLIGSSLTVAMAIRSAQNNQKRGLEINLLITIFWHVCSWSSNTSNTSTSYTSVLHLVRFGTLLQKLLPC